MTIYERIETSKKKHSLNNRLLGEVVGDSEMAFGQSMRRQSLTKLKEKALSEYLDGLDGNVVETKNPPETNGFNLKEQYEKLLTHYVSLVERLEKDLDFERSKNNKI